jgi:hypothetical protein
MVLGATEMHEPMPSMLTSKAFRRGYGVCCALYGIFSILRGHTAGYLLVILGIVTFLWTKRYR